MGLESANYYFKIKRLLTKEVVEKIFIGDRFFLKNKKGNLLYCDFDYWIDIMFVGDESEFNILSIRIALCNPVAGIEHSFKKLLQFLFSKFPSAELIDLNTKATINHFDEVAWNVIWNYYKARRIAFSNRYGHLELPVSSELFFKYIDEKEG